jgi:carbamoyltransferase
VVWKKLGGEKSFIMHHAYWGPKFENAEIEKLLVENSRKLRASGCSMDKISDIDMLCTRTAHAISDGNVIGWFQGPMEWGPRALGNRSILGDPRRGDMKDILNLKIKRRESFRPFAPSILEELTADWFEYGGKVPFMMQVYPIKAEKRSLIPAVTHVDGSGRLQTVSKETNPRYHKLISEFNAITGIPMVLNTSFNENEPVVCKPSEALDCFLRTKMDVLVMGDWYISRSSLS